MPRSREDDKNGSLGFRLEYETETLMTLLDPSYSIHELTRSLLLRLMSTEPKSLTCVDTMEFRSNPKWFLLMSLNLEGVKERWVKLRTGIVGDATQ
ncbi:hypothetical protein ACFX11_043922 [Malus domestica]